MKSHLLHTLITTIGINCYNYYFQGIPTVIMNILRGRPFDSWGGGGLWFFCEKKDCSANF